MKSNEEKKEDPTLIELKKMEKEEKYPSLEEFQKFNPFYEREKARMEFREKRRQLRADELSNISTDRNQKD